MYFFLHLCRVRIKIDLAYNNTINLQYVRTNSFFIFNCIAWTFKLIFLMNSYQEEKICTLFIRINITRLRVIDFDLATMWSNEIELNGLTNFNGAFFEVIESFLIRINALSEYSCNIKRTITMKSIYKIKNTDLLQTSILGDQDIVWCVAFHISINLFWWTRLEANQTKTTYHNQLLWKDMCCSFFSRQQYYRPLILQYHPNNTDHHFSENRNDLWIKISSFLIVSKIWKLITFDMK